MFKHRYLATVALCLGSCIGWPMGKLVVCGDDWSLSDTAFTGPNGNDVRTYSANIAQFLCGGSGSILDVSSSGVFAHVQLKNHLTGLGYSYTKNTASAITLALLQPYEAVIFGGVRGRADVAANLTAVTNYINSGGNVYLALASGAFGGAANESAAWSPLTNLYGISIGSTYVAPPSLVHVTINASPHPLAAGLGKISVNYSQALSVSGTAVEAIRGGPELSQSTMLVATTPFADATIAGTVELKQFVASPSTQLVTAYLVENGTIVETTPNIVLNGSGEFSFTTSRRGVHQILLKGSHWLRKQDPMPRDITDAGITGLAFSLTNGDIDGDNTVSLLDYDVFSVYFDRSSADSDWNTVGPNGFSPSQADLDGGDAVDLLDYDIFSESFDMVGD